MIKRVVWRLAAGPLLMMLALSSCDVMTAVGAGDPTSDEDSDGIRDPAPPPTEIREFFGLDPYYQQWIDVGGFPVLASAKVSPYAVKEAAWLITKMIGHHSDVLRVLRESKARFSVIGHTEVITEIPEYRSDPRPDFLVYRERGWGGSEGATASTSEESILNYRDLHGRYLGEYSALIHEFAHAVHILGLNTLDPTFDERLQVAYETATESGLWQGTYASTDRREYWAEGTMAWFFPEGAGSFEKLGDSRKELKQYDPGLAALLTEIYGDADWRYTFPEKRLHLSHLKGFDPQDAPIYRGFPELEELYRQFLSDPQSTGGGRWVNLKPFDPQLRLDPRPLGGRTTTIGFVNLTDADVLLYYARPDGQVEGFWTRARPGRSRVTPTRVNRVWVVKDVDGESLAVFRAESKVGRALIGSPSNSN